MEITLKIVTPDGVAYDSQADSVSIPTTTGEITVLPHHVPLVSLVEAGELRVKKNGVETNMAVSGGVVEIRPNSTVYVLAETAEKAEHIDLSRAEAARARAVELMSQKQTLEEEEYALIVAKMEKELARLRVGKKYRDVGKTQS